VVSVVTFGPSGREFDAHSLLRLQLPGETLRSEQLITVISVTMVVPRPTQPFISPGSVWH